MFNATAPYVPGGGIVTKAVQQHLIDRGADHAVGRLDQPEPQIAGRILDPVEVARDPSVGRQDHDRRGVRELADVGKPREAESHCVRQAGDRWPLTGQEVPAIARTVAAVVLEIGAFFAAASSGVSVGSKLTGQHIELGRPHRTTTPGARVPGRSTRACRASGTRSTPSRAPRDARRTPPVAVGAPGGFPPKYRASVTSRPVSSRNTRSSGTCSPSRWSTPTFCSANGCAFAAGCDAARTAGGDIASSAAANATVTASSPTAKNTVASAVKTPRRRQAPSGVVAPWRIRPTPTYVASSRPARPDAGKARGHGSRRVHFGPLVGRPRSTTSAIARSMGMRMIPASSSTHA